MLNQFEFSLPEKIENAVQLKFDEWKNSDKIGRIWNKDASVWTNDDEHKWLGWLEIVEMEIGNLEKYKSFAEDVKNEGFTDIVLCGMGGSSLCPEVLAETFNVGKFHVLDSTVPAQIKTLESNINLEKSLFIVSSKSGSTLETNIFRQLFFHKLSEKVGEENAGKHFVAVTDPDSKLQKIADEDNFRKVFHGEPTVGGRFSALTAFGLVPAAAMQLDVEAILNNATEMVHACKSHLPAENPGAFLGTILGVCHKQGRDKLTIFTSPEIYDLGAWLEQLIAESTGKKDVSIIPIDREEIQEAENYDEDRVFAYLKLKGTKDDSLDEKIASLEAYGHPFVRIEIEDKLNIGQEFFRWEFATAVAGAIMEINPFNQPDVEAAKVEARKLTDKYEEEGELPAEEAFFEEDGIKLFSTDEYVEELDEFVGEEKSLKKYIEAHIQHLQEYDYFAVLGYIEMNEENEKLLQELRHKVLQKELVATALGFGPRFLHSTGQAYKGGANNGVFLQITSEDKEDIDVPGQKYSFGVVKAAQARGDFQVLLDRERRALRVHLSENTGEDLRKIIGLI
ncbi:MAG: bifunctional transaldolase/phosoglucose isomerase [Acidobacteriota bacterium]|jgi:glucose-6-phosphate isomerase|nr:bifunctional transaldolase/phosoglucose isomerase [Acidobacteriota bacterium]